MSSTVLADQPRSVTWEIHDTDLASSSHAEVASLLAAAASVAPDHAKSIKAAMPNGDVVWVLRGPDGRFDPDAPVFMVESSLATLDTPEGPVPLIPPIGMAQIVVDYVTAGAEGHARVGRTLTAAGMDFDDDGTTFLVPEFSGYRMRACEVVRWLRDHGVQGLHQ